jgi:hypothetical protein
MKINSGELYSMVLTVLGYAVVWGGMAWLAVVLLMRG